MSSVNNDFPIGSPQNPIIADYSLSNLSTVASNQSTLDQSTLIASASNLSANLPALESPTLSVLEYLSIISKNLQQSKEQLLQSQITTDVSTTDRSAALAVEALNNMGMLLNLKAVLSSVINTLTDAATALAAMKPSTDAAIDAYNDGLDDDEDAVNDLQSAYNNWQDALNHDPPLSPEDLAAAEATYQAAIATYNAYVATRNPTIISYNSSAAAWNTQANTFNSAAGALNNLSQDIDGLDQIPEVGVLGPPKPLLNTYTDGGPVPLDPPDDSVDHVTAPSSDLQNPAVLIQDYFTRVQNALLKALKDAAKGLKDETAFNDILKFYLGNLSKLDAPNAFLNPNTDNKTEISGGQGATPTSSASLSSIDLIQVISTSILNTDATKQLIPTTQINSDAVNELGNSLISTLGLASVVPSVSLLAEKAGVLQPGSAALNIAVDAQTLLTIVDALHTTTVLDILDQKLKLLFPTLTDEERKEVLQGIIAALIAAATAKVAESTNLPGLVPQLALGASGKPEEQAVAEENQPQTFSSTTENRTVIDFIIERLEDAISKLKLEQSKKALQIAVEAFEQSVKEANRSSLEKARTQNELAVQDQKRLDTFSTSLQESLVNQGIQNQDAQRISQQAGDLLRSQIQQQSQNTFEFNQNNTRLDVLNQSIASSLQNQSIVTSRDEGLQLAQQVTSHVFGNAHNLTDTQVRTNLSQSLETVVPKISDTQAAAIAQASAIVPVVSKDVNPLEQANVNVVLSKPDFSLNVLNAVTNQLSPTVGLNKAQEIASNLTIALNGAADTTAKDNNARQVLTDVSKNENRTSNAAAETFTKFVSQFSSITELNDRLTDPANTLLLSQVNGITYSQPGPTPGMGQGRDVAPTFLG